MEIVDIKELRKRMDDSRKPDAVILVFSNNCGHCTSMMPEWQRLEKQVKRDASLKTDPRCYLSKVESHNTSMIPEIDPESIRGVPTIKFLKEGKPSGDYEEVGKPRNAEDMLEWIRSKIKDDNVKMHITESSSDDQESSSKSILDTASQQEDDIDSPYDLIKEFSKRVQSSKDDDDDNGDDNQQLDTPVQVNKKPKTRKRRNSGKNVGKKPIVGRKPDKTNRKPRKRNKPKKRQSGGWRPTPRSISRNSKKRKDKKKGKTRSK